MTKRRLTSGEIEDIISFIIPNKYLPENTANSIVKKNKDRQRRQLKSILIYPTCISDLKKEIEKQYWASQIDAGECVGIVTPQSIGERLTQSTLNTFHHCGISESSVLTGVPRFTELLMATKRPKGVSCRIPFLSNNTSIQELRQHIANSGNIDEVKLKDVVISEEITEDKEDELWYESFRVLYNNEFSKYTCCISFVIDMNKLFEYTLSLSDIANALEKEYGDITCVFSPPIFGQLDVFVETTAIELSEEQLLFVN